jgi:hypothetical protein
MMEYVIFIGLFVLLLAVVIYNSRQEQKRLDIIIEATKNRNQKSEGSNSAGSDQGD